MYFENYDIEDGILDVIHELELKPKKSYGELIDYIKKNYVTTYERIVENYIEFMGYNVDLGIIDYDKVFQMVNSSGQFRDLYSDGYFLEEEYLRDSLSDLRDNDLIL